MAYFIRVDTETEVAYELVAEPTQEQQAGEPQAEEAVEPVFEEVTNPSDLRGKPRSISLIFNYSMFHLKYCAFTLEEFIVTIDA